MKKIINHFILALLVSVVIAPVSAQTKYSARNVAITVAGTSTLHDWKETSNAGTSEAVFHVEGGKLTRLGSLSFTVPTNTLKSESKTMDKNTHKALKADQHPNITYTVSSATISAASGNRSSINTKGKLTIAGTTRDVSIVGTGVLNADNSITVTGSEKFKMTDFNVQPPKVMLIKTGNDITVSFSAKYVR